MVYCYNKQIEILNKLKQFVNDQEQMSNMSSYALSWAYEILKRLPLPAAIVGANKKVVFANIELTDWLGYTLEELKTKEFDEFTVKEYVDPNVELFEELIAGTRRKYTIYKKWITNEGKEVAGLLSVSVYVNGAPWTIAIIMPDYLSNEAISRSEQFSDIKP